MTRQRLYVTIFNQETTKDLALFLHTNVDGVYLPSLTGEDDTLSAAVADEGANIAAYVAAENA